MLTPVFTARNVSIAGLLLCLVLLSLITVFNQVKALGLSWQEAHYVDRLESVATGSAPAPGAYRVLSDISLYALCLAAEGLGVPRGTGVVLVGVRLVQNFLIFALCILYYRRLGIPVYLSLLGVSAMAWGMTLSNYNSDLSVNIYTELILYLAAAWAVASGQSLWIIPLTVLAAFNRETGIFIPILLLASRMETDPVIRIPQSSLTIGAFALGLFVVIQAVLHLTVPTSGWPSHGSGAARGVFLLVHNLSSADTVFYVVGVLGIVPVIAFAGWRFWPSSLHNLAVLMVPAWFLIHFSFAAAAEARFFLVPQAIVFVPGALSALLAWQRGLPQRDQHSVWQ